jgi:glycosyltransferase involved in cell wall biosynthesis
MAAYNGGAFVEAQLHSILPQLNSGDEVVIVDDGSMDDTLQRVTKIGDARVRLLRHEKNAGVVATFEDALRSATGDVLFLCDDDDLWAPTKVRKFLDVFERQADVGLAHQPRRQVLGRVLAQSLHESLPGVSDGGSRIASWAGTAFPCAEVVPA